MALSAAPTSAERGSRTSASGTIEPLPIRIDAPGVRKLKWPRRNEAIPLELSVRNYEQENTIRRRPGAWQGKQDKGLAVMITTHLVALAFLALFFGSIWHNRSARERVAVA